MYLSREKQVFDVFSVFKNEFNRRVDTYRYKSRCTMLLSIKENFSINFFLYGTTKHMFI